MDVQPSVNANRRKHPRIPVDTEVRIRVGGKDFFPLRCTNISMGGLCVQLNEDLVKGAKGKLFLDYTHGSENISLESPFKILWVATMQSGDARLCMGFEFFKMKRKHQDSLLRLLRILGNLAIE